MSSTAGSSLSALKIDLDALSQLSPAEQDAVKDELRWLEEAARRNPLLLYRPHSKQQLFHAGPWPPLRAFFGGNRSGKTTAAMVDTIIQCVDDDMVPEHLKAYRRWPAPFKCRVLTPDFGDTHEVVLEKIREWCPKEQLRGGSFDRGYDKVKRVLWFKNDSRLHFNSNVQDREQLGGSDLHRIVYDEEPRQDLRIESMTRLIDHDGEEIFAMTPLEGMSWLFDELYEPWERGVLPEEDARVLVVDMDDNPHLSERGKARALAAYSDPLVREARKSGRFVSFAGLIYTAFNPDEHTIAQIDRVPAGAEVFCGIDPGIRHMCAVLYCYLDENDVLVVFDEIAMQGATIREVCSEMERRNARWGTERDGTIYPLVPRWHVIDPAARNKNNQTGRSDQSEFLDNGVVTIPGQNAVGAGINRVKERLMADKLKVAANCPELLGEFRRYRWVKQGRTEGDTREAPVKKDDHLLDALRYVVMQRPLVPERDRELPSESMKQRLLRNALKAFSAARPVDHPSGSGIFQ